PFLMAESRTELRRKVIAVCAARDPRAPLHFVIRAEGSAPSYFIKYGYPELVEEGRTLQCLYDLAQSDIHAPRVPEVYDCFSNYGEPLGTEYLVMEYIPPPVCTLDVWIEDGQSDEERQHRADVVAAKVADLILWLHACPVPPESPPGPIGGGLMHHNFFADGEAPMAFASTVALEIYVNKVSPAILSASTSFDRHTGAGNVLKAARDTSEGSQFLSTTSAVLPFRHRLQ
ncbi:hypothetical protein DXG01_006224, partial [Tephrocybe rancida]